VAGTCAYGEGLSGSINEGNFLTSCKVYWLASQEGLCSMEYNILLILLEMRFLILSFPFSFVICVFFSCCFALSLLLILRLLRQKFNNM